MFARKIWLIKKPNKYKVLPSLLRTKAWRHGAIMGRGWLGVFLDSYRFGLFRTPFYLALLLTIKASNLRHEDYY